jgi:hypothetical protein
MDNSTDSFNVHRLDPLRAPDGLGLPVHNERDKKHERQQPRERKEAKDYFHTLKIAAEKSNDFLTKKGLPYRFHVHMENEEVFIDLVALDEQGNIIGEKRKNISYQDFARLIEDVSQIEGIIFDGTA